MIRLGKPPDTCMMDFAKGAAVKISPILDDRMQTGESPLWCGDTQSLWWVDIPAGALHCFCNGSHRAWSFGEPLGPIALTDRGRIVLGLKSGFALFDPATESKEFLADPEPDHPANRLNDGAVSRGGRFFAASVAGPPDQPRAALHRLGRRGALIDGLHVGNGLAFSPDDRTLYLSDSWAAVATIWQFDHDPATGEISNRRIFRILNPDEGRPDGGCIDAEGFYWCAAIGASQLLRLDPEGQIERSIPLPITRPTKIAFGGPNLGTIYATSIAGENLQGDDGRVLALDAGIRGLPEPKVPEHSLKESA